MLILIAADLPKYFDTLIKTLPQQIRPILINHFANWTFFSEINLKKYLNMRSLSRVLQINSDASCQIGAIISYCNSHKEPLPDWKNLGFAQLRPFLQHLASQNHIHFIGDHIAHPDNEGVDVDIVEHEEDEESEDAEPMLTRSTSSGVLTHAKAISSPKLKKSGSFSAGNDSGKLVSCPICTKLVAEGEVNRHLDECLNLTMLNGEQTNGANNAANNAVAVPNNNNPRANVRAVQDEKAVAHATRSRSAKRKREYATRHFVPNKRARVVADIEEEEDSHEEEEEEEEENLLVNNNNNALRIIADQIRDMQQQAAVPVRAFANNQTNQVHLSDDSDGEEEDENNAQGGGDSRFAEKILDRNITDKECIICYMPLERGTSRLCLARVSDAR